MLSLTNVILWAQFLKFLQWTFGVCNISRRDHEILLLYMPAALKITFNQTKNVRSFTYVYANLRHRPIHICNLYRPIHITRNTRFT